MLAAFQQLQKKDWLLLLAPLLVGVCCIVLWWYELHEVIGWQGKGWLRTSLNSVYAINALIVLVFLLPLIVELKMPIIWMVIYSVLLYATSMGAFIAAQAMFRDLYVEGVGLGNETVITVTIWKFLGLLIIVALVFFIPIRHFHRSTEGMHVLTIIVALISVIPASIISLENLPLWAHQITFLYTVKVGYPVFWTPIFLGLLSTAAAKEWV